MPSDLVHFAFVIEGQGEVEAIPLLIRRICNELFGVFAVKTARPVRVTKSKLIRAGELERAVQLALSTNHRDGPVLVVLDSDEDCPAVLGPNLKSRVLPFAKNHGISVIIPKYEFETWFLTAAKSLSGHRGLRERIIPPDNPESVRGAKQWLSRNMTPRRNYSPTVDQAALVARMDLIAAKSCQSFDRLCREVGRLLRSFG